MKLAMTMSLLVVIVNNKLLQRVWIHIDGWTEIYFFVCHQYYMYNRCFYYKGINIKKGGIVVYE
jgi:hypothetical protein